MERFHGTLKSILGKCVDEGKDWVEQLSFALFVMRQMPHADSGFSPFDLVYGFRVRTLLDALCSGLFEVDSKELNVCEWVRGMAEKLELSCILPHWKCQIFSINTAMVYLGSCLL